MIEFYPQIHAVHVWAIALSGMLMAIRGLGLIGGMHWPRGVVAWSLGLAIDGTVLTAAAMLFAILPSGLFANHWLWVKLIFVTAYFATGYWLLLVDQIRLRQALLLATSMGAYALAYGVARAHNPAGWLAVWGNIMNRLRIKRIYEAPSPDDGQRVLVDRLWPRGVSKERAKLSEWYKDIAPSSELRKWFGHDPVHWLEFQIRYRHELEANPVAVAHMCALRSKGDLTLLYAALDPVINHAGVLLDYLHAQCR